MTTKLAWAALHEARSRFPAYSTWLTARGWREGHAWEAIPSSFFADYLAPAPPPDEAPPSEEPAGAEHLRQGFLAGPPPDHLFCLFRGLVRRNATKILFFVPSSNPPWFADWLRVHIPGIATALGWQLTIHAAAADINVLADRLATLDDAHDQLVIALPETAAHELIRLLTERRVHFAPLKLRLLVLNATYDSGRRRQLAEHLHLTRSELLGVSSVSGYAAIGVLGHDVPLLGLLLAYEASNPGLLDRVFGSPRPTQIFGYAPEQLLLEPSDEGLLLTRRQPAPLVRFRTGLSGRIMHRDVVFASLQAAGYDPVADLEPLGLTCPDQCSFALIS